MPNDKRLVFVDLSERDLRVRIDMAEKVKRLENLDKDGKLSKEQENELDWCKAKLDEDEVIDPFYRGIVASLLQKNDDDLDELLHEHGLLGSQKGAAPGVDLTQREIEVAAISGLMQLDGFIDPDRNNFQKKVAIAQGEYRTFHGLFTKVIDWLSVQHLVSLESQIDAHLIIDSIVGCVKPGGKISSRRADAIIAAKAIHKAMAHGGGGKKGKKKTKDDDGDDTSPVVFIPALNDDIYVISSKSAASVVRKLVADRVTENDSFLTTKIEAAFESSTGVYDGAALSSMEINLPDLEETVDVEIVKENLYAVQAMYFFMMLEEARLPQVVDYIADAWRRGAITLGRGAAGDALYRHHRSSAERLNEVERRNFFMGTFGSPGGDPGYGRDNALFYELMLRTTSAVSNYFRKFSTENIFLSQETIRKACRELAANLSVNGYGMAHYTAVELQQSILEYRDLLSDPEILRAFGARDMWQVVDQVNANYLGGLRNTYRFRVQAHAGAVIIRWLANNHTRLVGRSGQDVISTEVLRNPNLQSISDNKPLVNPTDWDFVNACEQWLAVGGVQDESVERYSQPIESPAISSRPVAMPRMAQEVLQSVGIEVPAL